MTYVPVLLFFFRTPGLYLTLAWRGLHLPRARDLHTIGVAARSTDTPLIVEAPVVIVNLLVLSPHPPPLPPSRSPYNRKSCLGHSDTPRTVTSVHVSGCADLPSTSKPIRDHLLLERTNGGTSLICFLEFDRPKSSLSPPLP